MINWIIHISILAILAYLYHKRFNANLPPIVFLSTLLLKMTGGLVLGWIFIEYYQAGDTIMFFEKSKDMASLPFPEYIKILLTWSSYEVSQEPRVLFFTKFLSFFVFITNGSYWISSLYLSLLSFFATWYLVTVIKSIYSTLLEVTIVCFLLIPTVVFWSSGILKDSLAFCALAFVISNVLKIYHSRKPAIPELLIGMISVFILFKLKHYLMISFLLFVGLLGFLTLFRKSRIQYRVTAVIILVLAIISTQFIHPYLRMNRMVQTIYENNQVITENTAPENRLSIHIEAPDIISLFKEVPKAIHIGLFRPSIIDKTSVWGQIHRIENTILTFLFFLTILLWIKYKPKIDVPLVISSSITILVLSILLALSTPNFGTLVRYKNAFLPYFFLLCSILPYRYFSLKME